MLFIVLYKTVVLPFRSAGIILNCNHANQRMKDIGTVYYALQVGLTFEPADEIRKASLKCHRTNESYH